MKKLLMLCFGLILALNLNAQKKSKKEVLELMAEDTCECISKKKLKVTDGTKEKEMALGLCLITSFNEHKSKSKYYSKKTLNDIEEIGEDVGLVMATMCADDFLSIFSSEELVDFVDDDTELDDKSLDEDLSIEVELIGMNNDAISYITTKDDFDKMHLFLIMDEFEGSEFLKKSNFSKVFKVDFKEIELFDLSEKQYITKKVITKIQAL